MRRAIRLALCAFILATTVDAQEPDHSAHRPERWAEQLAVARGPLGALTSRMLAVEQALNGIPGAPPGEYVVQQYHSVYGSVKALVETVSLNMEADGVWRVVGYFIR